MTDFVLASRNKKKIGEMRTLLAEVLGEGVRILSLDDIGYEGDIDENGETFEANSITKAATVAKLGFIGIADDSGLAVDALGGAPGVYSARYSDGEPLADGIDRDTANNNKLLRELDGVADADRGAAFVSTVACVFPNVENVCLDGLCHPALCPVTDEMTEMAEGLRFFVVRGEFRGVINHAPAGCGGFGYDPLFFLPEYGMTSAEITAEEKNRISHRGKAVRAFGETLKSVIAGDK